MRKISLLKLLKMYQECAVQASKMFLKNWIIVPASIVMYLALVIVLVPIFGSFGLAGGLVLGILVTCMFTYFYTWISRIVNRERLLPKELTEFDYSLFVCIINTGFVLWIIRFLVDSFTMKSDNTLSLLFNFAVVLLCNPLPEVLYQKRHAGLEALSESMQFTQTNWHIWFLPFILVLSPLLVNGAKSTLLMFGMGTELLPSFVIVSLGNFILPFGVGFISIGDVVGVILLVWFTLFRGFLYTRLETGGVGRKLW